MGQGLYRTCLLQLGMKGLGLAGLVQLIERKERRSSTFQKICMFLQFSHLDTLRNLQEKEKRLGSHTKRCFTWRSLGGSFKIKNVILISLLCMCEPYQKTPL